MKRLLLFFVLILVVFLVFASDSVKDKQEIIKIKQVIIDSYISGIHIKKDIKAIQKGFDPGFDMLILKDNIVKKFPLNDWITRLKESAEKGTVTDDPQIEYQIPMVDLSGNAAVARIELFKNGKHIYTDYMSLYKIGEEWKIVSKIFYSHNK